MELTAPEIQILACLIDVANDNPEVYDYLETELCLNEAVWIQLEAKVRRYYDQ